MPVYNGMPYLVEAIESILAQCYGDFAFIIADDGSTDGSLDCMLRFAARDPRIRVIRNEKRLGPARSSQKVASAARTPFVARMDADDLSHPERLAKQMAVMLAYPSAAMVGSLFNVIDRCGNILIHPGLWRLLVKQAPPIAHPSILYRREHFDAAGGYSDGCDYFEDKDLYSKIAELGEILVLPEPLCTVRYVATSATLNDDRGEVESQIGFSLRRFADPPEDLTDPNQITSRPRRVDPRTLIAIGNFRMMSGMQPKILSRMLRRARLWPLRRSVLPVLWAICATISPSFAKAVLRWRYNRPNISAAPKIYDDHVYRWNPNGAAHDLGLAPKDIVAGFPIADVQAASLALLKQA
jgi:glycosyltransferase involved in cell wall biosynthesis